MQHNASGSSDFKKFGHITVGTHIYKLSNEEWDEQSKLKLATTCSFPAATYIVSNGWWQITSNFSSYFYYEWANFINSTETLPVPVWDRKLRVLIYKHFFSKM